MSIKTKILPVLLCGGKGSRLWPLSRKSYPKQYLSIDKSKNFSFLQETINRIKDLNGILDPILVCSEEHRFIAAEQLRALNVNPYAILLEPCSRNTAPAIATAALHSRLDNSDHILLILPSDHLIKDKQKFHEAIKKSISETKKGKIVTFGVEPNNPATGYGYIKAVEPLFKKILNAQQIEKFVEKPSRKVAEKLISDGRYSWNSGIFLSQASTFIKEIDRYSPEIIISCKNSLKNKVRDLDFERIEKKSFEKCPNISLDEAVMEKTDLGVVFPLVAGWCDIGSWNSYWENKEKDGNGNILIGDAVEINSKNSLISSHNRLTIALGIKDLIVVETNDAVLVAHKNESENVKSIVELLKKINRREGEENKKVYRPWGNYISLEDDKRWKVKIIEVNPHASLSLQLHKKRAEHWVVVRGFANVEINNKNFNLTTNQSCFVPIGAKHRLSNPKDEPLIIIEVQSGEYLGEDDIVRFKDNYGRN